MFDRVVRSSFDIHSNDSSWWDGEPIWIHAEKNKKKTLVDWAGSLISFDGVTPSYTSPNLTISGILQYFEMPNENQPQFIALNYPHLRNAMTKFGMMSSQASEALCRFDDEIGQLLEGLTERNVTDSIDIVIVSDSGMYPVLSRLNLDEIVPSLLEKTSIYENIPSSSDFSSTYVNLEVKHPQDISPILQCLNSNQNLKCHLANQIPSRFHIANSTRIGDIHCRSIPGTIISLKDNILPITQAASGYDNLNNEMQASFISYGSLFKKNYKMKEFKNIDVFNVISYLLDLDYIGNQSGIDTIQEIVQLY
jgi:predicted AlkP superfamily pyrophosphatase or phosphodiesterase